MKPSARVIVMGGVVPELDQIIGSAGHLALKRVLQSPELVSTGLTEGL